MATLLASPNLHFNHHPLFSPCSSSSSSPVLLSLTCWSSNSQPFALSSQNSSFLSSGFRSHEIVFVRNSTGKSMGVRMSWDGLLFSVKLIIQGKNLEVYSVFTFSLRYYLLIVCRLLEKRMERRTNVVSPSFLISSIFIGKKGQSLKEIE